MGATRKLLSVCTFGLIDWRSDKERTAKYARQTRDAARRSADIAEQQARRDQR